jgi:hypothetical protein
VTTLGTHQLKGFADNVVVHSVAWEAPL